VALTDQQLAALLRKAGVSAGDAAYLVAIAHPESSATPGTVQQGQPYATTGWGLWQITPGNSEPSIGVNDALLHPETNARAAAAKLKSQGLGAWTTYTSGAYQPYFGAAEKAVSSVYGMSLSRVDQLAASAGTGSAGGGGGGIGGDIGSLAGQVWKGLTLPFGALGGLLSAPSDIAKSIVLAAGPLVKIAEALDWFFHPSHWIRLFAGIAGGVLVLGGVWQMSHAGEGVG